ncbi:TonB-dependent siderophore receptor, partial [Asaia sp. SF2.1]
MKKRLALLTVSLGAITAVTSAQQAHAQATHPTQSRAKAAKAAQKTDTKPHTAPARRARPVSGEESVIVTGTHAVNRKARDSTSPITVISGAELARSGQLNLTDAITRVYPAINIQARGSDTAALTGSIRMRGLNPNQVLVLVDGKRRHVTGNVVQNPGPQFGSTPVDLNMIPANAIDHIEVLQDGAAAQYGSDAIA